MLQIMYKMFVHVDGISNKQLKRNQDQQKLVL